MLRKFIFKNNVTGREVILPVTPAEFDLNRGVSIQTVDVHGFGEYTMPGSGMTLFRSNLEFILPKQLYSFCNAGTNPDPYYYIEFFQLTSDAGQLCRFVVSGTPTVCDVYIENLQYGERDGTNDIYCTLTMRRWRPLLNQGTEQAESRAAVLSGQIQQEYVIKRGDTLSSICRKFYGDASYYTKLAEYNAIANPHLIFEGKTLEIPLKSQL